MQLCADYARDAKNLSMERIADGMGLPSVNTLYKWVAEGRMPANFIRPFENTCGCTFVTKYIAASSHHLVVAMPTSHKPSSDDLLELNALLTTAVASLGSYYKGETEADAVITTLTEGMEQLAAHRANVERDQSPELDLFGGEA
ncbi:MAG: hypothetical protein CMI08_09125 [Oceanospirillaceae bacterium]|nr:hypothetical protein [Thalassolituus sp.]MAX99353.1 hypothetical protein [Oceanospirillaceae bacterium]|tara:strand:- start:56 stop:487 length:432 start_codon:yes stop_codon:yes gene_type:complete